MTKFSNEQIELVTRMLEQMWGDGRDYGNLESSNSNPKKPIIHRNDAVSLMVEELRNT